MKEKPYSATFLVAYPTAMHDPVVGAMMVSPVFMAAVAILRPHFQGPAPVPFYARPLERASYLLNKAAAVQPVVASARGWLDHFLQVVGSPSPAHVPVLDKDLPGAYLQQAVNRVADAWACPSRLVAKREAAQQACSTAHKMLATWNKRCVAAMPPHVRSVSGGLNVATIAALSAAAQHHDVRLPTLCVQGFPIVGYIPASDIFPLVDRLATCTMSSMHGRAWFETASKRLSYAYRVASPEQRKNLLSIATQSDEAVQAKWAVGPYLSPEEVDALYPDGWHCMVRFPVPQGEEIRPCDNACGSMHNEATSTHETIRCVRSSLPADIATAFMKRWGCLRSAVHGGTDDLKKAYWRVANSQPQYSLVMLYHPGHKQVVLYNVPGQCFGLCSAVLNFNRFPEFSVHCCQRMASVCVEHFYDDFVTVEPVYMASSGQKFLHFFQDLIGFPLDLEEKYVKMAAQVVFVGVRSDFATLIDGFVTMGIKPGRAEKIAIVIASAFSRGSLSAGASSSLAGKLFFMQSTAFGRVGKALLQVVQLGGSCLPGTSLYAALMFFLVALQLLPKQKVRARRSAKPPLYIWADAYYTARETIGDMVQRGAGLGLVIFDPVTGRILVSHMQTPEYFFALFEPKSQYVGQLESLAQLAATITAEYHIPGCLSDRDVIHFIDNTSSMEGLKKGYSSKPDTALILLAFWIRVVLVGARPYFEYVRSACNIADLPSRNRCDEVTAIFPRAEIVDMRLPPQDMWGSPFASWPRFLAARVKRARPCKARRSAK